jgi:hypothetical protein
MIQQLSLTLFFTNYKPNQMKQNKTKQLNPFLVETAVCEFFIAAIQHYSCFASMTLPYYMYFIKYALEISKVKIKLLEMTFKGKQSIFLHHQPSSAAVLYLHSEATMMPIVIHSQQEPLICTLTQEGSLAVAQVVMTFLLSLLIYTFQV